MKRKFELEKKWDPVYSRQVTFIQFFCPSLMQTVNNFQPYRNSVDELCRPLKKKKPRRPFPPVCGG